MDYELKRIWRIFIRYRKKFLILWAIAFVGTLVFYLITPPKFESDAAILMENTRKPWEEFKTGALPARERPIDEENKEILSLRDPFWNFLYDQLEKTTYDFKPFFYARTTVFNVMDSTGCRQHFDDGTMTSEEIVLAFTENLDVEFDHSGSYTISYRFVDPVIARAIVNRYTELFQEFVNELSHSHNILPSEVTSENIKRLESEIADIEKRQAVLKEQSGVIAPTEYFTTITSHMYSVEMKLAQAESRAKASLELISETEDRIRKMSSISVESGEVIPRPAKEVLADPLLVVIVSRIFWDSINLTQARMIYLDGTPQVEFWQKRLDTAKSLLMQRIAEDEKGRLAKLISTLAEESAKALYLRQVKSDIDKKLQELPKVETEYVLLHRRKLSKLTALAQLQDLHQTGESYLQKGDRIAAILDSGYLPREKSEPNFWKLLILIMFATTVSGFGWFFIRENIEHYSNI